MKYLLIVASIFISSVVLAEDSFWLNDNDCCNKSFDDRINNLVYGQDNNCDNQYQSPRYGYQDSRVDTGELYRDPYSPYAYDLNPYSRNETFQSNQNNGYDYGY